MVSPTFICIQNLKVAYYQQPGAGIPVVFLHGRSLSAQTFGPQFSSSLLQAHPLISFDLPGHGVSEAPADPSAYTLPNLAQLVLALLEALHLSRVVLVGHSLGGHLAMEIAATAPPAGLVLYGAAPLGKPADLAGAFNPDPMIALLNQADLTRAECHILAAKLMHAPDPTLVDTVLKMLQQSDPGSRPAIGSIIASGAYTDELKMLQHYDRPVALVHGEQEPFIRLDYLQNVPVYNLFDQEVKVIPQAGHIPSLEMPKAFNQILAAFLQDNFK